MRRDQNDCLCPAECPNHHHGKRKHEEFMAPPHACPDPDYDVDDVERVHVHRPLATQESDSDPDVTEPVDPPQPQESKS